MLDPRISLMGQQASVTPAIGIFQNVLNQRRDMALDPLRKDLLTSQVFQSQQNQQRNELLNKQLNNLIQTEEDAVDLNSIAQFTMQNQPLLKLAQQGNVEPLKLALQTRSESLKRRGRNSAQTDEALVELQVGNVENVLNSLSVTPQLAGMLQQRQQTAGQQDRQALLADLQSNNPDVVSSAKVALGIAPRAATSAQERIALSENITQQVASSQAAIEGAKESAKLKSKIKLEPELQSRVNEAKAKVKQIGDQAVKAKSNSTAFNIYQQGIDNLSEALGQTSTGFFSGLLPAFTSGQQTAQGAISIMGPVLKQMFRGAGEGTFTDKDQELLMAMLPTRSDNPEAIQAKLQSLDSVVRAKLGQPVSDTPTTDPLSQMEQPVVQSTPNVIRFDAQGNMINDN